MERAPLRPSTSTLEVGEGTLRLSVVDREERTPLPNVVVDVMGPGPGLTRQTGDDGRIVLEDLPAGIYTIVAHGPLPLRVDNVRVVDGRTTIQRLGLVGVDLSFEGEDPGPPPTTATWVRYRRRDERAPHDDLDRFRNQLERALGIARWRQADAHPAERRDPTRRISSVERTTSSSWRGTAGDSDRGPPP